MNSLRRNNLWLTLVLVLAMVSTIGGAPAVAGACGDLHGALAAPAAAEFCPAMGAAGHCCCGPEAGASAAGLAERTVTGELTQPGCGCAVQAPAVPQSADRKAAILISQVQAVILPSAPVSLRLPEHTLALHAALTSEPPRAPYRSSSPSRAPPPAL